METATAPVARFNIIWGNGMPGKLNFACIGSVTVSRYESLSFGSAEFSTVKLK